MNKQEYILTLIQEECAELSQRASKALRFGLDEIQAGQNKTNLERLEDEAIDVMTVLSMLDSCLGNPMVMFNEPEKFELKMQEKLQRVVKYMDYSREQGNLNG